MESYPNSMHILLKAMSTCTWKRFPLSHLGIISLQASRSFLSNLSPNHSLAPSLQLVIWTRIQTCHSRIWSAERRCDLLSTCGLRGPMLLKFFCSPAMRCGSWWGESGRGIGEGPGQARRAHSREQRNLRSGFSES